LAGVQVVAPTGELVSEFEELVSPLMERVCNNLFESRTLAELRDALLSKLMSGEIEAPDGLASMAGNRRDGLNGQDQPSMESMQSILFPAISANAALVLIGVASVLLDRQVAAQAAAFEAEGGFTERLYRTRQARRNQE
jgi:four helix bundle suffix protein